MDEISAVLYKAHVQTLNKFCETIEVPQEFFKSRSVFEEWMATVKGRPDSARVVAFGEKVFEFLEENMQDSLVWENAKARARLFYSDFTENKPAGENYAFNIT